MNNIDKFYGKQQVLSNVQLTINKGEVVGLLGPNGAGKTVMLNILTGIMRPSKGQIFFRGENITNLSTTGRCRKGIGRTFQVPRPFEKMTVFENILVGSVVVVSAI